MIIIIINIIVNSYSKLLRLAEMDNSPAMVQRKPGKTGHDKPSMELENLPPGGHLIASSELFGGNRELRIVHNNELYRLRITANDKLILTK